MSDPRRRNEDVEPLQLFSPLCAVEHCRVEGEAAPCKDEPFQVAISVLLVFHNTAQS